MGDCGRRGGGLFSQCTDPRMTNSLSEMSCLTGSGVFPTIPRICKKRQLENEIVSTMEPVTLAMLLESDSESGEVGNDYDDLLSTLALAYHAISNSRYLNRGTRGSAGQLPIEDAIVEYQLPRPKLFS